jgi:DNA-binding MarR family transcriptional regulator
MTRRTLRLDAFVPYRMSIASNRVSQVVATAYEALFGLSIPEWRLVAVLAETPAMTQLEIGVRTAMDKMTVSRAAIALVERGLVAREDHPSDRRSNLLSLTDIGTNLYEQVAPAALDLERRLLSGFSAAEIEQFLDVLRRLELAAADLRQS